MANDWLLEGVNIFIPFPQTTPMLIPDQLRMDSSFGYGSESLYLDARDWAFIVLAQRCPNGLSKHTLRSVSQTLRWVGTLRERERERERIFDIAYLSHISLGFFIVIKRRRA